MARVQDPHKNNIQSDIMSAWQAIEFGVVDQNNRDREKYWTHWKAYTRCFKVDPFLQNIDNSEKMVIITAFAARVRSGCYGKGKVVRVSTVKKALAAIAKTIELAGEPSPIHKAEKAYKVPVARLIEGYTRQDPPSTPQLALPVTVVNHMHKLAYRSWNSIKRATSDLATIAFYYLLRTGEYTKPKLILTDGKTKRRTRIIRGVARTCSRGKRVADSYKGKEGKDYFV